MARDILKAPTEGVPRGYTPGPWLAKMQFGEWFVRQNPVNWDGRGYQFICSLPAAKKATHLGEMFASNARLISAAPDLLEALQYLSELYDRIYFDMSKVTDGEMQAMKRAWEIADAAINKATK